MLNTCLNPAHRLMAVAVCAIAIPSCAPETTLPASGQESPGRSFDLSPMEAGGCHLVSSSMPGTVRVPASDGASQRWRCPGLAADDLLRLADAQKAFLNAQDVASAQATAGHWEYPGFWREYCLINPNSYPPTVINCGIWYYIDLPPVWVPGEGGGDDGGGGGGSGSPGGNYSPETEGQPHPDAEPDEIPLPCVITDAKCHIPLTGDDIQHLNASYQYLRDTTGIWSDTTAQRQCIELFRGLQLLRTLDPPRGVFRGVDSTHAPESDPHDAQSAQFSWRFHFDPPILNKATSPFGQKFLLSTALHEVAHALGLADHDDPPDYPNDQYFKYTNVNGPNSCVIP